MSDVWHTGTYLLTITIYLLLLKLVKISKSCFLESEVGKFQSLGLICERHSFVVGLSKFKYCQNPMV